MLGQVTMWKMTEEERQAYIQKHPIRPSKPEKKRSAGFENFHTDYKWRGDRGAASRWGN